MFEDSSDLAPYRIAFVSAHRLDLLGDILAVEAVVRYRHRAEHLGLVLGPGVEIIVVAGSVGTRSVGHGRPSLKASPIIRRIRVGLGASSTARFAFCSRRDRRS